MILNATIKEMTIEASERFGVLFGRIELDCGGRFPGWSIRAIPENKIMKVFAGIMRVSKSQEMARCVGRSIQIEVDLTEGGGRVVRAWDILGENRFDLEEPSDKPAT
jgi:hypothetical protein